MINSKFHFLPENEILEHFLQMAGKHSTFSSHKESRCYDKWLRVAEWQGFWSIYIGNVAKSVKK